MPRPREVTVVTGLVTEKVLAYDGIVKMYERDFSKVRRVCTTGTEEFLKFDSECLMPSAQTRIYPVHHFRWGSSSRDLYVAYTKDVEQVLGIPINCMKEDLDKAVERADNLEELNVSLKTKLYRFQNMTFLGRLKFLFTGEAP